MSLSSHDGEEPCLSIREDHSRTGTIDETTDGSTGVKGHDEVELAKDETKAVLRLRYLVFAVLMCAAVAVSVVVYYISKSSQDSEFDSQFQGSASRILMSFNDVVKQKIAAVGSLAVAITAHAQSHNMTWPFVTVGGYPQLSASALSLSDAIFVGWYPVVEEGNRAAWEHYVLDNFYDPLLDLLTYREQAGVNPFTEGRTPAILQSSQQLEAIHNAYVNGTVDHAKTDGMATNNTLDFSAGIFNHIYQWDPVTGVPTYETLPGPYFPIYQSTPCTTTMWVNLNLNTDGSAHKGRLERCVDEGIVVLTGFDMPEPGDILSANGLTSLFATWLSFKAGKEVYYEGDPFSNVYFPVFDSFEGGRRAVAVVDAVINWKTYFTNILPDNIRGVNIVLTNSCQGSYTYEVNGDDVIGLGPGDLHDPQFDYLAAELAFQDLTKVSDGTVLGLQLNQDGCSYTIQVYPSSTFEKAYKTNGPVIVTCCVAITFVFMAGMFLLYDRLVERRQRLVLFKAVQSTALVSSLFPKNVRDRLLPDVDLGDAGGKTSSFMSPNRRIKSFLADGSGKPGIGAQPIADLFPHATVLFADVAGFTAWSSTRDPSQVFILLQNIYSAFDTIASRRNVFKVETIGDSYVAVAGLPDPQPNHAVIMVRFAWECIHKLREVTKEMERTLGPDTGDLEMRFGLHSGPVTAGVLLGDRARFQLFGDTVNVASRMESTGIPSRVQVSQATAALLAKAGKGHWIQPRDDAVLAKGKGVLNTFWVNPYKKATSSRASINSEDGRKPIESDSVKHHRLIDWIVELFQEHIRKVVARQVVTKRTSASSRSSLVAFTRPFDQITLDEVAEAIALPTFDARSVLESDKASNVDISPVVLAQLRAYVGTIASTYRNNPFHNFEHACHVTMAVDKFLRRIVAPDLDEDKYKDGDNQIASHLHDYTHGINSDPLTIFAIVFSALIHDVDHRGVSNSQLIKEEEQMANLYRNKSVAEQNSLDIAWDLLMQPDFELLRSCLFKTEEELRRFRQVIVNVVLATDIFDKELNDLRKARWGKAFSANAKEEAINFNNLRATIVIEHIIQASDVAHTMQHWHIYRKWNERLFKEMHQAYCMGRMDNNPSTFWYKGELGFFDNYIIPLAKKLKECNVFGVSSDECLNYAEQNRAEWEQRGERILQEMVASLSPPEEQYPGEK